MLSVVETVINSVANATLVSPLSDGDRKRFSDLLKLYQEHKLKDYSSCFQVERKKWKNFIQDKIYPSKYDVKMEITNNQPKQMPGTTDFKFYSMKICHQISRFRYYLPSFEKPKGPLDCLLWEFEEYFTSTFATFDFSSAALSIVKSRRQLLSSIINKGIFDSSYHVMDGEKNPINYICVLLKMLISLEFECENSLDGLSSNQLFDKLFSYGNSFLQNVYNFLVCCYRNEDPTKYYLLFDPSQESLPVLPTTIFDSALTKLLSLNVVTSCLQASAKKEKPEILSANRFSSFKFEETDSGFLPDFKENEILLFLNLCSLFEEFSKSLVLVSKASDNSAFMGDLWSYGYARKAVLLLLKLFESIIEKVSEKCRQIFVKSQCILLSLLQLNEGVNYSFLQGTNDLFDTLINSRTELYKSLNDIKSKWESVEFTNSSNYNEATISFIKNVHQLGLGVTQFGIPYNSNEIFSLTLCYGTKEVLADSNMNSPQFLQPLLLPAGLKFLSQNDISRSASGASSVSSSQGNQSNSEPIPNIPDQSAEIGLSDNNNNNNNNNNIVKQFSSEKTIEIIQALRQTQIELKKIKVKIEEHDTNNSIATISGGGVGVAGGILFAVGLATIPFTLGASTPLMIAGAVIGGSGGFVSSGSMITEFFLERNLESDALELVTSQQLERVLQIVFPENQVEEIFSRNSFVFVGDDVAHVEQYLEKVDVQFVVEDFDDFIDGLSEDGKKLHKYYFKQVDREMLSKSQELRNYRRTLKSLCEVSDSFGKQLAAFSRTVGSVGVTVERILNLSFRIGGAIGGTIGTFASGPLTLIFNVFDIYLIITETIKLASGETKNATAKFVGDLIRLLSMIENYVIESGENYYAFRDFKAKPKDDKKPMFLSDESSQKNTLAMIISQLYDTTVNIFNNTPLLGEMTNLEVNKYIQLTNIYNKFELRVEAEIYFKYKIVKRFMRQVDTHEVDHSLFNNSLLSPKIPTSGGTPLVEYSRNILMYLKLFRRNLPLIEKKGHLLDVLLLEFEYFVVQHLYCASFTVPIIDLIQKRRNILSEIFCAGIFRSSYHISDGPSNPLCYITTLSKLFFALQTVAEEKLALSSSQVLFQNAFKGGCQVLEVLRRFLNQCFRTKQNSENEKPGNYSFYTKVIRKLETLTTVEYCLKTNPKVPTMGELGICLTTNEMSSFNLDQLIPKVFKKRGNEFYPRFQSKEIMTEFMKLCQYFEEFSKGVSFLSIAATLAGRNGDLWSYGFGRLAVRALIQLLKELSMKMFTQLKSVFFINRYVVGEMAKNNPSENDRILLRLLLKTDKDYDDFIYEKNIFLDVLSKLESSWKNNEYNDIIDNDKISSETEEFIITLDHFGISLKQHFKIPYDREALFGQRIDCFAIRDVLRNPELYELPYEPKLIQSSLPHRILRTFCRIMPSSRSTSKQSNSSHKSSYSGNMSGGSSGLLSMDRRPPSNTRTSSSPRQMRPVKVTNASNSDGWNYSGKNDNSINSNSNSNSYASSPTRPQTVSLQGRMTELNYEIVAEIGRGDCFFGALSFFLKKSTDHHLEVRRRICDWMEENSQLMLPNGIIFSSMIGNYFEDLKDVEINPVGKDPLTIYNLWVKELRNPGTWANEMVVIAAAHAYQVRIRVLHDWPLIGDANKPENYWGETYNKDRFPNADLYEFGNYAVTHFVAIAKI